MKDLAIKVAFGLLRTAAAPLIGWFSVKDILNETESLTALLFLATLLVTLVWSGWSKIVAQRKLNTAIATPTVKTLDQLNTVIASGTSAPAMTPTNVVPILTGTGNVLAIVLSVALGGSVLLSGCATVAPNPTTTQVQTVRQHALTAVNATNTVLGLVGEARKLVSDLPLPVATKDAVDCAIATTVGTTTPAPAVAVKICGAIPLATDAPLARGLRALESVATCPSLSTSVTSVLGIIDPLIQKLEAAKNASLMFVAASLRMTIAVMRGMGGASCQ